MFQEVINQVEKSMHSSVDDYVKDGLLYCGKCNTPKQKYVATFKKNMPIMCDCKKEEIKQQEDDFKKLKKKNEIRSLRESCLMGEKYRSATFDNTETKHSTEFAVIYNRCKKYCTVADAVLSNGTGIYLFGTNGTGKSWLTACMGNELMNNFYTVLYTNFADISKKILTTNEDFINRLAKIDFLFVDDFGTEKVVNGNEDKWLQEIVFEVINKRYIENKPIIFTSNYSLQELIKDRGMAKRTVDRIMEMCEVMRLDGVSYRVTKMKQREKLF